MSRKGPYSDQPIELRNLPRLGGELEHLMGLFVEKMITVATADAHHLVDEAFLGLRTAAAIRRDLAVNADDRDQFEKAVRELDYGLWQRDRPDPLSSELDCAAEVVIDETSARTMTDGTSFVARVLIGLRDVAQDLRRRADTAADRARFENTEHEIADAIQRLGNSWDGLASALEIIVDEFSIEAITQQTDFVIEILRELRSSARLKCEFADDYSRDRLAKAVRELDEALRRLDAD
jgi:hypothetical protein